MEFPFDLWQVFKTDNDKICILDGLSKPAHLQAIQTRPIYQSAVQQGEVITKMGTASGFAQKLKQAITTSERFFGQPHRLYIKIDGRKCLGFVKVGEKNLFHRDGQGVIKELKPLCLLDFYVHESVQRGGIGKELFTKMLEYEKKEAWQLAYDRPSQLLLSFMRKHYGLVSYIPQNNNYVIFSEYFRNGGQVSRTSLKYDFNKKNEFSNIGRQVLSQSARSSSTMNRPPPYATTNDNDKPNERWGGNAPNDFSRTNIPLPQYKMSQPYATISDIKENQLKKTEQELDMINIRLAQLQHNQPRKQQFSAARPPWAIQDDAKQFQKPPIAQKTGFY